jgi:DNA-binding NtrC family response regulator
VRLIAATNKNLAAMVSDGKFREDLFFRLSVVPVTMPPLRARKEDIPMLVQAFLKGFAEENKKPVTQIADAAMQALLRHDWPGNVRELRTAIEHGVVMATGPQLTFRDLPLAVRQGTSLPLAPNSYAVTRADAPPLPQENPLDLHLQEHQLILKALNGTGGNVTQAAKKLGISRRTLHRKLKDIKGAHSTVAATDLSSHS